MTTELQKVEFALTEFQKIEAGLAELREKYTSVVYPVTTVDGMRDAKAARRAIRDPRIATETVRKEAKAPILALGRQLDAKAQYITEELQRLEGPIDAQIKVEEARKEQAIYDENMRVIRIKERIHELGLMVPKMAGQTSAEVQRQIDAMESHDLTEWAEEFIAEAEKLRDQTVQALRRLHAGAIAQEQTATAEAAKAAAERAELENLRREAAERQAAEEARTAAERAEREAQAAEVARLDQVRMDEIAAKERAAQESIEKAEAESRARIAQEERAARERRAALEREEAVIRAKQVELADAEGILRLFVQRYSKRSEFSPLVTWINKYFVAKKQPA